MVATRATIDLAGGLGRCAQQPCSFVAQLVGGADAFVGQQHPGA